MIYFLIYLFLEIFFSYEFMRIFTPLGFFFEVLATAIYGVIAIRNLQFSMIETFQKVLYRQIDSDEFVSIGLFKFVGAVLIFIPGFFSDILGFLLMYEPFAIWFARKFLKPKNRDVYYGKKDSDDVIDVEIIEDKR